MGFKHQLFADHAGKKPIGEPKDSEYPKLHDAKMRAREWLNSERLMAQASNMPGHPVPQSVKVFDSQGGTAFHDNDTGPTRGKVTKWRDAQKAKEQGSS